MSSCAMSHHSKDDIFKTFLLILHNNISLQDLLNLLIDVVMIIQKYYHVTSLGCYL